MRIQIQCDTVWPRPVASEVRLLLWVNSGSFCGLRFKRGRENILCFAHPAAVIIANVTRTKLEVRDGGSPEEKSARLPSGR